ncbi:MAG TPA: stage V sporulation protein AE [Tissierellaceae bacterium]
MDYLMAFLIGGLICAIGQVLMDFTPLAPAHVLVLFVTLGVILSALGLYQPLVDLAGAGATVPLPGFGHTLARGVIEEVNKYGLLGILTGGLRSAAAGITAAIVFGYIMALIFNPKPK